MPSDPAMEQVLQPLVVPTPRCVGISSAVIRDGETTFRAFGESGDPTKVLDENSLFDVGSITKVFTGVLLAEMASRAEVELTDPLAKFLPDGAHVPNQNGHEIRLVDLATHTSGLPRLPPNMMSSESFDPEDPYAHVDESQLLEGLAASALEGQIGSNYNYSNFGFELLAFALSRAGGATYSELLAKRILRTLGLEETSVWDREQTHDRLVPGHGDMGERVKFWSSPMPGDGGVVSTASELAKFLVSNLERNSNPLASVLAEARRNHLPEKIDSGQGLGWVITEQRPGIRYHWHNGGVGGYGSFMGIEVEKGVGVVLLSNSHHSPALDSAGGKLLDSLSGA